MKHSRLLRCLAYTIELVVLFVVQQAPGFLPEIHNGRPLLLVPLAVCVALFEPQMASMAFGAVCGLFLDVGCGSGVLGPHAMLLAAVCFAVSYLAQDLIQTTPVNALLICALTMGAIALLQWLLTYVAPGYPAPMYALVHHYLPRFAYTVALALPIYALNRLFAVHIQPLSD